ncbi:hypothetical protein EJB05_22340, partial [Eragrostis curvula]
MRPRLGSERGCDTQARRVRGGHGQAAAGLCRQGKVDDLLLLATGSAARWVPVVNLGAAAATGKEGCVLKDTLGYGAM